MTIFTFWYKSVISSVEIHDQQIIACHFSYHTLYQPSFIYHPLSLSVLGLLKGMIWKMTCNNLYITGKSNIYLGGHIGLQISWYNCSATCLRMKSKEEFWHMLTKCRIVTKLSFLIQKLDFVIFNVNMKC